MGIRSIVFFLHIQDKYVGESHDPACEARINTSSFDGVSREPCCAVGCAGMFNACACVSFAVMNLQFPFGITQTGVNVRGWIWGKKRGVGVQWYPMGECKPGCSVDRKYRRLIRLVAIRGFSFPSFRLVVVLLSYFARKDGMLILFARLRTSTK